MEWDFEFTVSKVSRITAETIMRTVQAIVEAAGGEMGGGFVESKDEEASDDEEDA